MGMQIFGGYGYNMEFDMQRHYRDARAATIAAGSSQIQRNLIANLMGLKAFQQDRDRAQRRPWRLLFSLSPREGEGPEQALRPSTLDPRLREGDKKEKMALPNGSRPPSFPSQAVLGRERTTRPARHWR